jgi:hypothetical protein
MYASSNSESYGVGGSGSAITPPSAYQQLTTTYVPSVVYGGELGYYGGGGGGGPSQGGYYDGAGYGGACYGNAYLAYYQNQLGGSYAMMQSPLSSTTASTVVYGGQYLGQQATNRLDFACLVTLIK